MMLEHIGFVALAGIRVAVAAFKEGPGKRNRDDAHNQAEKRFTASAFAVQAFPLFAIHGSGAA